MGIGQAITMPLFFSSNALYPMGLMPGWLQVINKVNPLTYEVEALRGLLIGTSEQSVAGPGRAGRATLAAITAAAMLLPRLARPDAPGSREQTGNGGRYSGGAAAKPDADGGTACFTRIARTGAPRGAAPPHSVTIQAHRNMYKP